MSWSGLHTSAAALISIQGFTSLLLFVLLSYELCALQKEEANGRMDCWKYKFIAYSEIGDLLLEIVIIYVFAQLQ